MDRVQWACYGAQLALLSVVPRSQRIYFLNVTIPKMKISTIRYYFFYFSIKNVLIDTGSPSNMPVDMSIVPHPHCQLGAPWTFEGKKVKVQVYSLISSLKTYHPTSHLTPWSLNLFIRMPFQLHGEHTVLQPFRRIKLIVHIAISVLPGIHFHLSQVKHLRVKCLAQGHNI